MDVSFGDDAMRTRLGNSAHNFVVLRHIALNRLRLDPARRKASLKVRRLIAASSDDYLPQLLDLVWDSCDCPDEVHRSCSLGVEWRMIAPFADK
jgi:hypothetical protein